MDAIEPSKTALAEAFTLSAEIIHDIEMSELPLTKIALKTMRLARLLNDFEYQKIFEYESGGYPSEPTALTWMYGGLVLSPDDILRNIMKRPMK